MRLKLFLSFILVVLVSVLLVAYIAWRGAESEVRAFMIRGGMAGLSDLTASLENYYRTHGTWEGVASLMSTGHGNMFGMGGMMNQRLLLADTEGNVVVDTSGGSGTNVLDSSQLDDSVPLSVDGNTVGYLYSTGGMGFNAGNEQQLLERLSRGVIIGGLVAGGLGLVLALVLAYTLLRPVRDLTEAAHRLSEGDLTQRVVIHGSDEMATLGHTFNHMADSLQQSEESRRNMTADIAHELRTPLAVQRANLEALQDGVYPLTVENLSPVIEHNHLLTRLVEDLRTLALSDAGQIVLERTPTNLVSLATRVVEQFHTQASTRQVSLALASPVPSLPMMSLDPIRVEQMLSNLLSNALRYTPPGGHIDVTITALPNAARISVHDSGPGLPEEALPYIFERFYRADKSRSRLEGGTGLGLAIARNLARAHDGDLTATNHASGGALFTLILPVDSRETTQA